MKQLALQLSADPPRRARTAALRSAHFQSHVEPAEALTIDGKAQHQEDVILLWFGCGSKQGARRWTPSEVGAVFPQWPLTSIRRALTNLTTAGKLVHHQTDRRTGPYGAKESTWSIR